MKGTICTSIVSLLTLAGLLAGCGGSHASSPAFTPTPTPPPTITSLSPRSAIAGGPGFTLTVNGINFLNASVVVWNRVGLPTTFVSSTQLTASVRPGDIASAGTVSVFVSNNNGAGSSSVSFEISNPQPTIATLAPSNVEAGAAPFMLLVNGSGFAQGAAVLWNGAARVTTFVSATQVTAAIPASDVAAQGSAQVSVANTAPAVGPSAPAAFTINPRTSNPAPEIIKLSDSSAPAGWPGFPLTIDGTGFVAASTGQWNGADRATTAVSSSQLKTAILLSDLAQPGTAMLSAFNPLPGGGVSSSLNLTINAVAPGAFGVIERSSLATDLTEPDEKSYSPSISADGRFVVFVSDADNLVPQDKNLASDVFLRDTCIGAPAGCVPSVTAVTVGKDGGTVDAGGSDAAISANARYIAFSSSASNLVPGAPLDRTNLYVRDTCFGVGAGCAPGATLVWAPGQSGSTYGPTLSADGRYIAFQDAEFTNCDYYGDCNTTAQTMVSDTCAGAVGCTPATNVVSLANDGSAPDNTSLLLTSAISSDGRFIAFTSLASNLVAGDNNNAEDVFLRDTCIGATAACTPSTQRISVANDGSQLSAGISCPSASTCEEVSISATGRFITFTTNSNNAIPGDANANVFVRDTCLGAPPGCSPSTKQVSLANDGAQPNSSSSQGKVSADGRYVVFVSDATNLVIGDISPFPKVFLRDTCPYGTLGCTPSTTRLSVALDGTQANNLSGAPMLNRDSHFVVFSSSADNLAPGDTNQVSDVFVARTIVK